MPVASAPIVPDMSPSMSQPAPMIGSGTDMMPVPPMMGSGDQMPMTVPPMMGSGDQMPMTVPPMLGSGDQMPMPVMNMGSMSSTDGVTGSGPQVLPVAPMGSVSYKPLASGDEIDGFNFDDVLVASPI